MKTRWTIPLLVLTLACSSAADGTGVTLVHTKDLHAPYDGLLTRHVRGGAVDYAGLSKEAAVLDAYLAKLAVEDETKLPRADRLAFWINAYNAFTLALVLEPEERPKSIRDLPSPWDSRRWKAAGRTLSLNDIEHEILRKEFREPRIHFALVCAARSCPDLRSEAWQADRIEEQLADATARFLGDRTKGLATGTASDGKPFLRLSRLFDWYRADFETEGGTVLDFLIPRLGERDGAWLRQFREPVRVEYLEYDWSLNDR
jgi:hypothetical protein